MKKAGIIILVLGILITIFTGFNLVTRKKVLDVGELEITTNKNNRVAWSPIVGVVVSVIGGGIYLLGGKKE